MFNSLYKQLKGSQLILVRLIIVNLERCTSVQNFTSYPIGDFFCL